MSQGIVGRFLRTVEQSPTATAVVGQGATSLDYAGLERASAEVASALGAAGVGPGHVVPVSIGRSIDFVVAVVGIVRCGAAYVPVDPAWPRGRREALLAGLPFQVGIVGADHRAAPMDARWRTVAELSGAGRAWTDREIGSGAPLYLMFTSGSSGTPKGVVVPHRGVERLVRDGDYAEFRPGRRWAFLSSTAFDASTLELWGPLLSGGTCVLFESSLPSIDEIADGFRTRGITDAWLTAALFHAVVDERLDAFAECRQILTGGEVVSPRHARRFLEAHPTVRLINGYGPTENTTFSLCHTIRPPDAADDRAIPIGRPIAGTTTRIVDRDGRSVAPGQAGELLVGGQGLALGYWNDPTRTAERFIRSDGEEGLWYRTGDLVRQDMRGVVHYVGRLDRQVKIRGHRVEPEEVERHLLAHPAVRAAFVEVQGDSAETRRLVAVCEVDPVRDGATSGAELRKWLSERLPAPLVPAAIEVRDRLLRNASGKIDRASTAARARAVAPLVRDAEPPDGPVSIVLDLARSLLPECDLAPDSDFIAEGGDSLRVLRLVALIRRRTGFRLTPSQIFAAGSIREISGLLPTPDAADTTGAPHPHAGAAPAFGPADGSFRLTATARSLVYEWRIDPSSSRYHEFVAFRVPVSVSPERLRERLLHLLEAVPILRSVFAESGGALVGTPLPVDRIATWACPPAVTMPRGDPAAPHSLLADAMRAPLDLERTGPFRAHIGIEADHSMILGLAFHHAIIDEWALARILSLLGGERHELTGVAPSALEAAACWEMSALDRTALETRAEDLARSTPLTEDKAKGWFRSFEAQSVRRRVESDLVEALFEQAARLRVTPFAILIAAFARALSVRFALDSPAIATPFSLRGQPDCADVIGCLIDFRLVRFGVAGSTRPEELARSAADLIIAEHDVASCPLDALVAAGRRIGVDVKRLAEQFAFTYREEPYRPLRIGGVVGEPIVLDSTVPRFGLLLQCERRRDGLELVAQWAFDGPEAPARAAWEILDDYVAALRWIAGLESAAPTPTPSNADAERVRALSHPPSHVVAVPDGPGRPADLEVCAAQWSRVLALGSGALPDPTADFFASGGSSLDALRLVASLRRLTGREIDLGAFVARPTLERLAALLGSGRPTGELACYAEGIGDFEIIAIPGSEGSALSYRQLWPALASRLPAGIGFRCMDFAEIESAIREGARVEAMSDRAAERVQRAVGSRPFAIVAYSLGGLLAVEVAARLDRRGHAPAHLVLLDCYSAAASFPSAPVRAINRAARWWHGIPGQRVVVARDPTPTAAAGAPADDSQRSMRRIHRRALSEAFRRHALSTSRTDTTFVVSTEAQRMPSVRLAGPRNGFAAALAGRVEIATVSIPHLTFLTTGVEAIAACIAPTLSRVIAASAARSSRPEGFDARD